MKTLLLLSFIVTTLTWACMQTKDEYIDLTTGKKVMIEKDKETGYMVNAETRKPVYLYVDVAAKDTFYGRTAKKVNGEIKRKGEEYQYLGDDDYVYRNGDYKLKVDADGDYKEKDGDYKLKVEADGDFKEKNGEYKKKVEEDGDVKIKSGNTTIKIDDGKKKVKKDD